MWKLLYSLGVDFYFGWIKLMSWFNPKAKAFTLGRKQSFNIIKSKRNSALPLIWMHASSLGEFEQGRPVLEKLKLQFPNHQIAISFFSPSGYQIHEQYMGADMVFYLPKDSVANAKHLLNVLSPNIVLWIKYDYWYFTLRAIHNKNIPLLLISGIFNNSQPFFKWYGVLHKQMLSYLSHLFVQDEESKTFLTKIIPLQKISVVGDTRFDRVLEVAREPFYDPLINEYLNPAEIVMVAGSTWEKDHRILNQLATNFPNIKFIIAPHNVDESSINNCLKIFTKAHLYSTFQSATHPLYNILIVDSIGMLNKLYRVADIVWIGGGFTSDGVHNVLEAAVYGKVLLHGPNYQKYREAVALVEMGSTFVIDGVESANQTLLKILQDKKFKTEKEENAKKFVYENAQSADKILAFIQANRLLTN